MPVSIFQPEPRGPKGWCPWDVQRWFNDAVTAGWVSIYRSPRVTALGERANLMMADGIQESGFDLPSRHPDGVIFGDHNLAVGIHQLHAFGGQTIQALIPPEVNILEAARRMASNRKAIRLWRPVHVLTLPEGMTPEVYEDHLTLDAQNRGLTGEETAVLADPAHPDRLTAHGNYAGNVLAMADVLTQLLMAYDAAAQDSIPTQPLPAVTG